MKTSPKNRLATLCGFYCSICDAYGSYVLSDGRQTVSNELRKIGWRELDAGHYICPSHTFAEILKLYRKISSRRKNPRAAK